MRYGHWRQAVDAPGPANVTANFYTHTHYGAAFLPQDAVRQDQDESKRQNPESDQHQHEERPADLDRDPRTPRLPRGANRAVRRAWRLGHA
jgi:hypothetical protein